MIQYIKDNGKKVYDRAMEYQFGKMELDTMDIGLMINSMEMAHFITMKVMSILEILKVVKLMAMESMLIKMEHVLKENIKVVRSMASENIHFLTENQEWVNGKMENEYNGYCLIKNE